MGRYQSLGRASGGLSPFRSSASGTEENQISLAEDDGCSLAVESINGLCWLFNSIDRTHHLPQPPEN